MPIPYWRAAERAERTMYSVKVYVRCRLCGGGTPCTVNGTDVTINGACDCFDVSEHDAPAIQADALAIAAGRRSEYMEHLRDGG